MLVCAPVLVAVLEATAKHEDQPTVVRLTAVAICGWCSSEFCGDFEFNSAAPAATQTASGISFPIFFCGLILSSFFVLFDCACVYLIR